MGYWLGVDLGTTYTAAAIHDGSHVRMASIGPSGAAVPSVLWLGPDDEVLVGDPAIRRGGTDPTGVVREFKRRFGDETPLFVGGRPVHAHHAAAMLLRWVVDRVAEIEGGPPDGVALCHPANWRNYKLEFLREVASIAEIDTWMPVSEPEAAAVHYAERERIEPGEVVAVYDLGGGTFDAAVLERTADGFEFRGEPEGIERLGGVDFDHAVRQFVHEHAAGRLDDIPDDDREWLADLEDLKAECTSAKIALSDDAATDLRVRTPHDRFEVRMTREDLERAIKPLVMASVGSLRRALQSARVTPAELSAVLLVGGSSRVPLVGRVLQSELGVPVALDSHPKHSIALGAAIVAASRLPGRVAPPAPSVRAPEPVEAPTPEAEALTKDGVLQVLADVGRLAVAHDRADLAERLSDRSTVVGAALTRVLVVGDYKQGKSSLVNALVGAEVCPAGAHLATVAPTVIRYGPEPVARVHRAHGDDPDDIETEVVPVADIGDHVAGEMQEDRPVVSCEIDLPVDWLAEGIELVDMPGVGGLDSPVGMMALAELLNAEGVLFVTDASQELTKPELDFLLEAERRSDVLVALTKVDFYPEWRTIRDRDLGHVAGHQRPVSLFPVASRLVTLGRETGDDSMIAESGIGALIEELRRRFVVPRVHRVLGDALDEARGVGRQLRGVLLAEREALDPAARERTLEELERSRLEAGRLKDPTASWYIRFEDGMKDLAREQDRRLQEQMRLTRKEADERLMGIDPGEDWDEFETWLRNDVSARVHGVYVELMDDAERVRGEVASEVVEFEERFLTTGEATRSDDWLSSLRLVSPDDGVHIRDTDVRLLKDSWLAADPVLAVGGYVPAGWSPIALVAGSALGWFYARRMKRIRRVQEIGQRRSRAAEAVEKYTEELVTRVAPDLERCTVEAMRPIRDGVYRRADELVRSLDESISSVRSSSALDEEGQAQRRAALDAEVDRLDDLMTDAAAAIAGLDDVGSGR